MITGRGGVAGIRTLSACLAAFGLCIALASTVLADRIDDPGLRLARARRVSQTPRLDGRLDDEVWRRAPVQEGFLQHDPVEGEEASERTTFQIIYDDEALYVGIRNFDSQPEAISARLTRRDDETEADWVSVSLDPHNDRQSGCWFTVYASGSVGDGVYSDDRRWDSVWQAATAVDAEGWSAEIRIPYHVLRFNPREEYTWGLNVERHISRKQETVHWSLIHRDRPGLVSQLAAFRESAISGHPCTSS